MSGAASGGPRESVSILLPVYNETEGLLRTLAEIRSAMAGRPMELIIVDDASTDGTSKILEGVEGVRLLRHPQNRGYGAALKTAIAAAKNERLAMLDADGSYPAPELPRLLDMLDEADMVVGRRKRIHYPSLAAPKMLGRYGMNLLASVVAARRIHDLNTGLRAFRRSRLEPWLPHLSERFSFSTGMTMAAYGEGWRVRVVPVDYFPRLGKSKVRLLRDSLRTVRIIFRLGWKTRPVWTALCGSALVLAALAALGLLASCPWRG